MLKRIDKDERLRESILELLNALNDPTRQEIVFLFRQGTEFRATDIASRFSLSRPAISHHLNLMKRSRILAARKEGKEIYYSLNKEHVVTTLELLASFLKGCC